MKAAKKSAAAPRKKRPPKSGTPVFARLQDDELEKIDEWIKQQEGRALTRPEAMKRLTAAGLEAEAKKKGGRK